MSHKKPLEPLIPLDDLKKVVEGLLRVPKSGDAGEEHRPKTKTKKQKRD